MFKSISPLLFNLSTDRVSDVRLSSIKAVRNMSSELNLTTQFLDPFSVVKVLHEIQARRSTRLDRSLSGRVKSVVSDVERLETSSIVRPFDSIDLPAGKRQARRNVVELGRLSRRFIVRPSRQCPSCFGQVFSRTFHRRRSMLGVDPEANARNFVPRPRSRCSSNGRSSSSRVDPLIRSIMLV